MTTTYTTSSNNRSNNESYDDLFIPTTGENIRSCYRLNLGYRVVDFAYSADNVIDRTRLQANTNSDYDDDDDDDDDDTSSPLQVAIKTAEIFNGIIVGKHGTILKQNHRAQRTFPEKLGTTITKGQSRQAIKIEQIIAATDDDNNDNDNDYDISINEHDNVDEEEENDDQSNTSSATSSKGQLLVVRGQYENVDCLIREGSKILSKNKWRREIVYSR